MNFSTVIYRCGVLVSCADLNLEERPNEMVKILALALKIGGIVREGRVSMRANGSFSAPCRCRSYDVVLRSSLTESNRESVNTWQLIPSVLFCNFSQLKSEHNPSAGQSAGSGIALDEARKLLRLVNVEALKRKLESEGQDFISFSELLRICKSMGITHSDQDAVDFAKALDAAGVILIFRNKVYLHPDKVAELVINAMPLALAEEDDPKRQELLRMQKEKQEIDRIAHKQVRLVLWSGLGFFSLQTVVFFRLTFWELSWDVMEPVTFFATTGGLLVGYMYFLITSRDPTYRDLMKRLFLSKQKKLFKRRNFNVDRFLELQRQCKPHSDCKSELEAVTGD